MMRWNTSALISAILFFWLVSGPGLADGAKERSWQVQGVSDRGVLALADGPEVCLGGLWAGGHSPSKQDKMALKHALVALIDDRPVLLGGDTVPPFDRYGCLVATVQTSDGVSLQRALLKQGLAMVKPSLLLPPPDEIDDWLALEDDARQAGVGLWRDRAMQPRKASAMDEHIGRTSLVEGSVIRTSSNKRYVYLNFGQDWRTDFTVRLRQKLLKKNGIEPNRFDGKKLRIRGFVQESRGPLIDISHLKQIEVIP